LPRVSRGAISAKGHCSSQPARPPLHSATQRRRRITRIPARPRQISPKEVRRIRLTLNASQALFATFLNVSPNAVRSWEQGTRRPRQAALKLLVIAKKNPKPLLMA
jgi:DNA-binding transcriptional regulator YiaG